MANNDIFLIDGIIDEIINTGGFDDTPQIRGVIFEEFAIKQILKTFDLTETQFKNGLIDGADDGGIDGFYIFVNGICVLDKTTHMWPRSGAELELFIITCKHHNTYELGPLESVDSSISELLDLNIATEDLKSKYKKEIVNKREILLYCYRKLAPVLEKCAINIIYASRGSTTDVAENIRLKGEKIRHTCDTFFQICESSMKFWGSEELIRQYRKRRNAPTLLQTQKILRNGQHFVALSKLDDYYKFITDDDGKLKRYYFEENVRDYLGKNRTNIDIARTLESTDSPDFWLLNNGITILAASATPFDGQVEVENVQIVNGLQTTSTLYQFFANGGKDTLERSILIKIIVSTEDTVRNEIIQATNNQSSIPLYSLHATDKIQKDIEDVMMQYGLGYERKDKYYANLGYDESVIFSPLYLASGYISLILKLPNRSAKIKAKFMNNPNQYERVFSSKVDLRVWPQIAKVLRKVEGFAQKHKGNIKTSQERYLRIIRPIIALVVVSKVIGKYSFGINDLIKLDIINLTDEIIETVTIDIVNYINNSGLNSIRKVSNRKIINEILDVMAQKHEIAGLDEIDKRKDFVYDDYEIDEDFLEVVFGKLPNQPWPVKIHQLIAKEIDCQPSKVYRAIDELIAKGMVKKQVDGVLY